MIAQRSGTYIQWTVGQKRMKLNLTICDNMLSEPRGRQLPYDFTYVEFNQRTNSYREQTDGCQGGGGVG